MTSWSWERLVSEGRGIASVEGRPDPAKEVRRILIVEAMISKFCDLDSGLLL